MEIWFTVPSSVPSTLLETSGATLTVKEIEELLRHPRVVGVAELMSYPGFLAGEESELRKVIAAQQAGKVADGHAPGLLNRLSKLTWVPVFNRIMKAQRSQKHGKVSCGLLSDDSRRVGDKKPGSTPSSNPS